MQVMVVVARRSPPLWWKVQSFRLPICSRTEGSVGRPSDASYVELVSGQDITITEAGVYVISGSSEDATIIVDTDDKAKVQLVLSGVSVTNDDAPAVYVKSADKVL